MSGPDERIEAALRTIGAEHEPPVGWQARVLARTTRARQRRHWWLLALPGLAVAAAITVLWLRPKHAFELDVAIESSGDVVRGGSAKVGDTLHASARGPGAHRAVWIYHDDRELVLACPGGAACRHDGDTLIADVTFATPGTYEIAALVSDTELPAPAGSFDGDVAPAVKAGATQYVQTVTVR